MSTNSSPPFLASALPKRIAQKIYVDPHTGCWLWTAHLDKGGYGVCRSAGSDTRRAHRIVYQLLVGPIPRRMPLDHICRVRRCVYPTHLRVVSPATNVLENSVGVAAANKVKTHCPKGHPYDDLNTYLGKHGRVCKACGRVSSLAWYHRRNVS